MEKRRFQTKSPSISKKKENGERKSSDGIVEPESSSIPSPLSPPPIPPLSKTLIHSLSPASRATPYPKVTVLFCRLPLLTLCPKLEAFHLWNLLRIFVRLDWKINLSLWFLWWVERDGKWILNSRSHFWGLHVDQTIIVINNTLGITFLLFPLK